MLIMVVHSGNLCTRLNLVDRLHERDGLIYCLYERPQGTVAVGMETSHRSPQNSVVRQPEFVWPDTTIPYAFNTKLGKSGIIVFMHVCI